MCVLGPRALISLLLVLLKGTCFSITTELAGTFSKVHICSGWIFICTTMMIAHNVHGWCTDTVLLIQLFFGLKWLLSYFLCIQEITQSTDIITSFQSMYMYMYVCMLRVYNKKYRNC